MQLQDLFEALSPRKELVIFPGAFHIFHRGHASVYNFLVKKFPHADVFVASSNDTKLRPFTFDQKKFLASQAGIPEDRFVEVREPYKAIEITRNYDPSNTVLIFALSKKDKDRLDNPMKKDGTPAFLQPYPGSVKQCEPLNKHGYYIVVPTVQFSLLGNPITSASQIREWYGKENDRGRLRLAKALYPTSRELSKVKELLDGVLGAQPITESTEPIRQDGWIRPNGAFIANQPNSGHFETLKKLGIKSYEDAYNKGWIHISTYSYGTAHLESAFPMSKISKRLEKIAKMSEGLFPEILVKCSDGAYEWTGKEFIPYRSRKRMHEGVKKVEDVRAPDAGEFIKKNGSKTAPITDKGWLFPSGRFVPNGSRRSHTDTAYKMGFFHEYDDAFDAGLIRVSSYGEDWYFETPQKMSPKLENLVVKAIKRIPNLVGFELRSGSGTGYFKVFKWDGKELVPVNYRIW